MRDCGTKEASALRSDKIQSKIVLISMDSNQIDWNLFAIHEWTVSWDLEVNLLMPIKWIYYVRGISKWRDDKKVHCHSQNDLSCYASLREKEQRVCFSYWVCVGGLGTEEQRLKGDWWRPVHVHRAVSKWGWGTWGCLWENSIVPLQPERSSATSEVRSPLTDFS